MNEEEEWEDESDEAQDEVEGWFNQFVESTEFAALTNNEKAEAPSVVGFFANNAAVEPEEWDKEILIECCVDLLPRKVTAGPEFFEAVEPVLTAFFDFLSNRSILPNAKALKESVAGLGPRIVSEASDPSNWGFAKTMAMAAMEEGVDLTDPKALDAFTASYNARILERLMPPNRLNPSGPTDKNHIEEASQRTPPPPDRYDPCPCGSGKKYKFCCGRT